MMTAANRFQSIFVLSTVAALAAGCCGPQGPKDSSDSGPSSGPLPTPEEVAAAAEIVEAAAASSRERAAAMTFDDFEASVYKEPFEGGKYIVNGDTPIANLKRLKEFYETQVQRDPGVQTTGKTARLIVHREGGQDAVWSDSDKLRLSYCVSDVFGARHGKVVSDMQAAGDAWERVAEVNFLHAVSQDGDCNAANANVMFDVRPVDVDGEYLARAFFPHEPRVARNVLIDQSAFDLSPGGTLTLAGILRHELGHTLGFRHEHTRPESGACFEDSDWRPLTNYDPFSVMHYPQCNGLGDWSLTLTHEDESGAACLYGAAPGFAVDPEICPEAPQEPPPCPTETVSFSGRVAQGDRAQLGPFAVAPGTLFEASMTGSGDPDLYVRFGAPPNFSQYVCRPYLDGAVESCSLDVPAQQTEAFVMVRGYAAGTYEVTITHTP